METLRKQEIYAVYVRTKSQAETARECGISRQRVQQVIKPLIGTFQSYTAKCKADWCGKVIRIAKVSNKGYCLSCYQIIHTKSKEPRWLNIQRKQKPECEVCSRSFEIVNRKSTGLNICRGCDATRRYREEPAFKEAQRRWQKKKREDPEWYARHKAYQKQYNVTRRDRQKAEPV